MDNGQLETADVEEVAGGWVVAPGFGVGAGVEEDMQGEPFGADGARQGGAYALGGATGTAFPIDLTTAKFDLTLDVSEDAGLSPDYVARETRRAIDGVGGRCRVLPGIDIGIPTGERSRKASPEETYAAVAAALTAGAHGVVLSRKYSEMRLANLAAAGRAVGDCLG